MSYDHDMNLVSSSGYCMPFEEKNGDVNLVKPYGEGHDGADFKTDRYLLAACADGIVSGIGVDRQEHGLFLTIKYGKWEVTYAGLGNIAVQTFDISRVVTVYPDRANRRWWTKCWFNGRQEGEISVEIEVWQAVMFLLGLVDKDEWLEEFYPQQMRTYHDAINQTREQLLLNPLNL